MKYLFINSVAGYGSTGKIVEDKCKELVKAGHQCVLAYGRQKVNCNDIDTYKIGNSFDYKMHGLYTRICDRHGFGSKYATIKFLEWVNEYDPDVIWLHNIHGYYINIEILFNYLKKMDKKVYWTLHDCWSFTGHCAYFTYVNCEKWRKGCYNCIQKVTYPKSILIDHSRQNYERKKKLFCGVKNMRLFTPSQWLAGLVKESYLKEYSVKVVRNQIDTNLFKPTFGNFREKYGLQNNIIILGVANKWDERKGLKDYIKLAFMLSKKYKIVLVGLDKNQIRKLPSTILGLPKTETAKQLAEIYTTADVFVNCTYEENYPTVNLEAQACGTPVITYDSGGAGETLQNEKLANRKVPSGDIIGIMKILNKDNSLLT